MGRHSVSASPTPRPRRELREAAVRPKKSRRGLITSLIAGGAVVAVVASVTFMWVGGMFEPNTAVASDNTCDGNEPITVVADSSIADVITKLAADAEGSPVKGGGCLSTEVVAQTSADTAAAIANGTFEADAWIPDSSVWVTRIASLASSLGLTPPTLESSSPIVISPVVLAAPSKATSSVEEEDITWARVRDRKIATVLPDPEASAASLAALYAVRGVSSQTEPRQFAAAILTLGKEIPASTQAAIASASAAKKPTVVVMSEAAIAAHNRAKPAELLTAEYPNDGTVVLDYPLVRVTAAPAAVTSADSLAEGSVDRSNAVTAFEKYVRAHSEPLKNAGFRRPDGSGKIATAGISPELPYTDATLETALKLKDIGASQVDILRLWGTMTLRSRMLAVIDVSGSMADPTASGLRRIDIFQQAAGGALGQFSGEVDLGVWVFSTARQGDQDWEELAPLAPLADGEHTAQVMQVIASLPDRLGGGTGLYDTTLAAVRRVREGYDPDKMNTVMLVTDGRNEDDNGGLDLEGLIAQLQAENDPERPVPVIMVGFGPDTDLAAMQRIAEVTGGAAYSAINPEDLSVVLVDALYQRGCRPDCG